MHAKHRKELREAMALVGGKVVAEKRGPFDLHDAAGCHSCYEYSDNKTYIKWKTQSGEEKRLVLCDCGAWRGGFSLRNHYSCIYGLPLNAIVMQQDGLDL